VYDYVIVGSGIAGLFCALLAAEHGRVLVVTKAALEESNTRYAQGGIAAAVGPADTPSEHLEDTLGAGAGLCEPGPVGVLTSLAPERIADLVAYGVEFDREHGHFSLGREGAHSRNRILHAGGDATGFRIETALCGAIQSAGVDVRERHFLTDLLLERGRARGISVISPEGRQLEFEGRHVVIATGGSGQLYRYTTNPPIATGDGLAVAYRAGAAVADLEFYQFHPTALALAGAPPFLISEAVRGEGGILRDSTGRAFMLDYDPRGELAPRDIVSRAIAHELRRGPVYLDVTHLPRDLMRRRFPTIASFLAERGIDLSRQPIPVAPAAHYQMGGILTSSWGETTLPDLYACGEVASTGVHGANRLASNSLLEGIVFASRVVRATLGDHEPDPTSPLLPPLVLDDPLAGAESGEPPSLSELQSLMWENVGLTRDGEGLAAAAATLRGWAGALDSADGQSERELANLATVGSLMAVAGLRREESRGAHHRSDFPDLDGSWRRRIVFRGATAGSRSLARLGAARGI